MTAAASVATGTVRSAAGHAFRVIGASDIVAVADDVFVTFPPVPEGEADQLAVYQVDYVAEGVRVGAGEDGTTMADLGGALDYIQWHLNQTVINGLTSEQTGLHAGCAGRNGRLVLLPATSGGGKSTTVASLLRAGWSYLTDEAAILDNATLEVSPYPKPVTLAHGSWSMFPQCQVRVRSAESCLLPAPLLREDDAEPPAIGGPGQVAAVVAPRHVAGADTRLEPLTPGQLVMLLAQSTFGFDEYGPRHLRCLARLARTTPGYRLTVGDLDEAVAAIERAAAGS